MDAVAIEGITLIACDARRNVDLGPGPWRIDYQHEVELQSADGGVGIEVRFALAGQAEPGVAVPPEPAFRIAATFLVRYTVASKGISTNAVADFAKSGSLFHCWPYWREFIQSTVARFGLPPLTLPLLKVGVPPVAAKDTESP